MVKQSTQINSNSSQPSIEELQVKPARHKFKKYILPVLIIVMLTILLGGYVLLSSAINLLKTSQGESINSELKTTLNTKLKDLTLGRNFDEHTDIMKNPINITQESGLGINLKSPINPDNDSTANPIVDKDYGYATIFRVYGSNYGDVSLSKLNEDGNNEYGNAEFDETKYYDQVMIYSAEFNKSYFSSQGKYYNYVYSDKDSEVVYYGEKYAAKIKYSDPKEVYFEFYPQNIWVLEALSNDPNARDLGTRTIKGNNYRYFEISQIGRDVLANGDLTNQQITRVYLSKEDLSVYRIEIVDNTGRIISATETIQENKIPINELVAKYKNIDELNGIELKEFEYIEPKYLTPRFVDIIKKYPILYSPESILFGYSEVGQDNEPEYMKIYRDPNFITQYLDPEVFISEKSNVLVSYFEQNLNYQIYKSAPTLTDLSVNSFGDIVDEKEMKVKVNGVEVNAKLTTYKAKDIANTLPGIDGEETQEQSAKVIPETSEVDFKMVYLLFNYQDYFYNITAYNPVNPLPTEYIVLDEAKAKEFDTLQENATSQEFNNIKVD